MLPAGALWEANLSATVSLWDVSHLLATGAGEYKERDEEVIRLYVHKSGADGPAGFRGALGMSRFCTLPKKDGGRGWPGAPYTFWGSRVPDIDDTDRMVIYRCQPDGVVSYHTGGWANHHGAGYGVQGTYDGEWDLIAPDTPRVLREPTEAQVRCLSAFVAWAPSHYPLDPQTGLAGHWEAARWGGKNKPVCPGDYLRRWVIMRRALSEEVEVVATVPLPEPQLGELDVRCPSVEDLQRALALLDHNPGPIDGLWGWRSRLALERFQTSAGLEADGWYGRKTAGALLEALRAARLSRRNLFKGHVQ